MHCAGQHKPYAEWHKPCRYYRLLFRNLQAPPQIPATVFCDFPPVLTTTLPALLPMAYAPRISVGGFRQPSSQRRRPSVAGFRCCFRRQIPAAFAVALLGFSQVSSLRAFIKMDQSCLSRLSAVYRMAPGSRSRSLRFRLTICSRSLIPSDWLSR